MPLTVTELQKLTEVHRIMCSMCRHCPKIYILLASLKNEAGVSVTSTKGKLEAFQKHYEHLGRVSIDSDFDSNWKELVERKVGMCGSLKCVRMKL